MAYKNSGAMKFNDATDLVIRADPDGTVESVYNKADGAEYISVYSIPAEVSATVTNNANTTTVYYTRLFSGVIGNAGSQINSGVTSALSPLKGGQMRLASGIHWNLISGEADVSGTIMIPYSNVVVTIEND